MSARGRSEWRSVLVCLGLVSAALLGACGGGGAGEASGISVVVSPANGKVLTGHSLQLRASVSGTPDGAVTWTASAGAVDAQGLFTATDSPGSVTVEATSVACPTCSGSVAIEVDQLSVSVTSARSSVLSGEQVQLIATVTGWSDTAVTWSANKGAIDGAGLFTAPGEAELGPVQVTATSVADPTRAATLTLPVIEIPRILLTTGDGLPVTSKEEYKPGTVEIDARDGVSGVFGPVTMQIKGRGNSTWDMPKKPYKVKLDAKASLLGMPADKEWALLANYTDKTLMRNSVALELGRRLGLPWSPRSRFVELWLNGSYDGTYLLVETVKVAPDRVDIQKMSSSDVSGDAVTGGYLLEVDQRCCEVGEIAAFTRRPPWERSHPFVLKDPGTPADAQLAYIEDHLQAADDALFSDAFADAAVGYQAYWDVQPLVDWYLVEEIVKNVDGDFFSSVYVSKDRLGKLRMGPLWDFDLAIGNADYFGCENEEGWYVRTQSPNPDVGISYYERLFQDPAFAQRVRERWAAVKASEVDGIFDYIDDIAASLQHAQAANFERWQILDECVWPNPVCLGDYAAEVDHLKTWLQRRVAWIDDNI